MWRTQESWLPALPLVFPHLESVEIDFAYELSDECSPMGDFALLPLARLSRLERLGIYPALLTKMALFYSQAVGGH